MESEIASALISSKAQTEVRKVRCSALVLKKPQPEWSVVMLSG